MNPENQENQESKFDAKVLGQILNRFKLIKSEVAQNVGLIELIFLPVVAIKNDKCCIGSIESLISATEVAEIFLDGIETLKHFKLNLGALELKFECLDGINPSVEILPKRKAGEKLKINLPGIVINFVGNDFISLEFDESILFSSIGVGSTIECLKEFDYYNHFSEKRETLKRGDSITRILGLAFNKHDVVFKLNDSDFVVFTDCVKCCPKSFRRIEKILSKII